MSTPTPRALLFDLGGVLIDVDFDRVLRAWAPGSRLSFDEMKRRFQPDGAYERHERGQISETDYFSHVATLLELPADHEKLVAGWNAIFAGEIAATRRRVEALRSRIPCFCFTNTNATHAACWSQLYPAVVQVFDRIFLSHVLHLRKPEPEAFTSVCRLMQTEPREVLFFDDNAANIEAAQATGLQTCRVASPDDVATTLRAVGLPA